MKHKTELEIAKENLNKFRLESSYSACITHKATCQRWFRFMANCDTFPTENFMAKMKDLKQTIALYEEEGI